MGLFDSLAKQALGGLLGGSKGGLDLGALMGAFSKPEEGANALSGMLGQIGGLEGLKDKFNQVGAGDAFASWVGTGENQAVAPNQVESALGSDVLAGVASKFGLQSTQLLPLLSQFLPMIIDKLTPQGQIDNNQPSSDQLQGVLASVVQSGLGGLFGGGKGNA